MKYFIFISFVISTTVYADISKKYIAEVVKIRGEATQLPPTSMTARALLIGDKLVEDTSIVTGIRSFIKIKFIDNSELNMGPESKIVITEMGKNSIGIISLLKGRIRTEVEKNSEKPNENKFFIKTQTAALGVRGTDFQTIYNPENKITSLLTYKGEVSMAKIDPVFSMKLESTLTTTAEGSEKTLELSEVLKNKDAVIVPPGQNSFTSDVLKKSSLPVKISPKQLEALYKNEEFEEKSIKNLDPQSPDTGVFKSSLKVAEQVAPKEGIYDEKTGDFAPRSGGFIDLNTGLYIAPTNDAKLDAQSGTYTTNKIGDIDISTGQYIAPKGLTLDARKGFIIAENVTDSKIEKKVEIQALKEDLNQNFAKDIVSSGPDIAIVKTDSVQNEEIQNLKKEASIGEKFIRDRLSFSLWSVNQQLESNKNTKNTPYLSLDSTGSARFLLDWQMASASRFAPLVGIDYAVVDYKNASGKGVNEESKKLLSLSYGVQYALNHKVNLFSKFGLHQEHYLDQTSSGTTNAYTLKKVVLSRLTAGASAELWKNKKWSFDLSGAGLLTFRKRINNLIINEGTGIILEILPKYEISKEKWLSLGLKIESQYQRIDGSTAVNRQDRNTFGMIFKYAYDI